LLFYDDENQYLIKEYIEGELLLDYISKGEIDLNIYVDILYAIYSAENNNMNIDYFPTNFLINDNKIFYVDYEVNEYSEDWDFRHWGIYMWMNVIGTKDLIENQSYKNLVTETGKSDCFIYHPFLNEMIDFLDTMNFHKLLKRDIFSKLDISNFELVDSGMAAETVVVRSSNADLFIKSYNPDSIETYYEELSAFKTLRELMPPLLDAFYDDRGYSFLIMKYLDNIKVNSDFEACNHAYDLTEPLINLHKLTESDGRTSDWLANVIINLNSKEMIDIIPKLDLVIKYLKNNTYNIKDGTVALLHGDYHIWNVLLTKDKPYIIDCHLKLGDTRLDVYWAYTLMVRAGFVRFANQFLEIYKRFNPEIIVNEDYFIVLSNILWFETVMYEIKDKTPNILHTLVDAMFEFDIMKQITNAVLM
jgi:fructosamine-3-kinase